MHSSNRGGFSSFGLGLGLGALGHGALHLNNGGHHLGDRGHSVYGHHGGGHHYSTYGLLYYDHRSHFYGPYRSYWSTAYYPDYAPIYGSSYGYITPGYGYSFGSVYSDGPRIATIYEEEPYVAAPYVEESQIVGPVAPEPAAAQDATAQTQGWGPILTEGNLAFSQGHYDDARRIYVRAMLIDERDGYAKMLYAWANFALGDYQLATTAMRRALLTSPDLVKYPIDIRLQYGDLAMLARQIEALQKHVAANPNDREAGLLLGYLFYSIGDLPRGLAAFNDLAAGDAADQTVATLREAATSAAKVQQEQPGN